MRSKATIIAIVVGVIANCVGARRRPRGGRRAGGGHHRGAEVLCYRTLIGPWQHRWNATDEAVARTMPGDELLPSV
jgi:hypothetical protein